MAEEAEFAALRRQVPTPPPTPRRRRRAAEIAEAIAAEEAEAAEAEEALLVLAEAGINPDDPGSWLDEQLRAAGALAPGTSVAGLWARPLVTSLG